MASTSTLACRFLLCLRSYLEKTALQYNFSKTKILKKPLEGRKTSYDYRILPKAMYQYNKITMNISTDIYRKNYMEAPKLIDN